MQQHRPGGVVKTRLPELDKAIGAIEQYRADGTLTISTAIKGGQLSAYKREYGKFPVGAQLMMWIMELSNTFAVGNSTLTEVEVSRIADELMRDYWHMKLPEFALFVDKAKRGDYGKVYNRLDGPTIHEWMKAYQEERAYEIEQANYAKKDQKEFGPQLPIWKQTENITKVLTIFKTVQEEQAREKLKAQAQREREIDQEAADEKMRWFLIDHLWKRYRTAIEPLLEVCNYRLDRFKRETTAAEMLNSRRMQTVMRMAYPAAKNIISVRTAIDKFLKP